MAIGKHNTEVQDNRLKREHNEDMIHWMAQPSDKDPDKIKALARFRRPAYQHTRLEVKSHADDRSRDCEKLQGGESEEASD